MTSGAWALALVRRLEISGGCCVVDGEDQVALAPAVLSYTTEPLPGGSLLCDLSCLAGGDARHVPCSVGGCGGDGTAGAHALCAAPVWGDVFYDEGPAGSRWSFPLGWQEG